MAPPRPALPTDCLFHVFLHLDPISIVRCAAVSRHWRRAVTDNASEIRRHSMGRADRYLLLGLPSREMYPGELSFSRRSSWLPPAGRHWSDFVPRPFPHAGGGGSGEREDEALACSDGLLLLCRGLPSEISVVNPQTGFHTSIARPGELAKFTRRYILHSCHGAKHNSFQVLAVDLSRKGIRSIQNYCSETGAWGPVLRPDAGELRLPTPSSDYGAIRPAPPRPLVCQGAIHWLCSNVSDHSPDGRNHRPSTDDEATKAVPDARRRRVGQENANAGDV
uniref:F-box domain-containing protein n=1 Tax=Setaria italica TaxID=4555 RepID=K4AJS0_SETIT